MKYGLLLLMNNLWFGVVGFMFFLSYVCMYVCVLSGLMCEILWSDPQPQPGRGPSKRGVGLSFGADVTKRFLKENNLGTLILILHFF